MTSCVDWDMPLDLGVNKANKLHNCQRSLIKPIHNTKCFKIFFGVKIWVFYERFFINKI